MKNEFITYEQAVTLKELGFNEPCFALFNRSDKPVISGNTPVFNSKTEDDLIICTPLYQQAFRWFREKYDLSSWISGRTTMGFSYTIDASVGNFVYNTHEEAEQACLDKLIKIIKDGK